MSRKTNAILIGLGDLGKKIALAILKSEKYNLLAVIDSDPAKADQDLFKILNLKKPKNQKAILIKKSFEDFAENNKKEKTDIAIVATSSILSHVQNTIGELLKNKINVISTCEELSYPFINNPEIAKELNKLADKNGVRLLGTGINPGFLMDYLPLILTKTSLNIEKIEVIRMVDVDKRREAFKKKICVGMDLKTFKKYCAKNSFGHVGLLESLQMIAIFLNVGFSFEDYENDLEPIVLNNKIHGIKQKAMITTKDSKIIKLVFIAATEKAFPKGFYDEIKIKGDPDINLKIQESINGDKATIAVILNMIDPLLKASPGLKTMIDFV